MNSSNTSVRVAAMPLTIAERKHLMPYGAQIEVARALGVSTSFVSAVMHGDVRPKTAPPRKKLRAVQRALAAKLGHRLEDVFPEARQEAAPLSAPTP